MPELHAGISDIVIKIFEESKISVCRFANHPGIPRRSA